MKRVITMLCSVLTLVIASLSMPLETTAQNQARPINLYGEINGNNTWDYNDKSYAGHSFTRLSPTEFEYYFFVTQNSKFRFYNGYEWCPTQENGFYNLSGTMQNIRVWRTTKSSFVTEPGNYYIHLKYNSTDEDADFTFDIRPLTDEDPRSMVLHCSGDDYEKKDECNISLTWENNTYHAVVPANHKARIFKVVSDNRDWYGIESTTMTTLSNSQATNLKKDAPDFKFADNTAFGITVTTDDNTKWGNPAKIDVVKIENYYLTGDFNMWATDGTTLNFSYDKNGNYVTTLPAKFHGQFQILSEIGDNAWNKLRFGHNAARVENNKLANIDGTELNDAGKAAYFNAKVPEMEPESANCYSASDKTLANFHLAANYYINDSKLYFNPSTKKVWIQGTPYNIYVYYFNENSDQTPKIKVDGSHANTYSYFLSPEAFEETAFTKVALSDMSEIDEANAIKRFTDRHIETVYRAKIYPGLEQPFTYNDESGNSHKAYFTLSIANGDLVDAATVYTIDGKSLSFISKVPARLLFQVKDNDGNTVLKIGDGLLAAVNHRFIDLDSDGTPRYVKADGGLTEYFEEALTHEMDEAVELKESDGLTDHMGQPVTGYIHGEKMVDGPEITNWYDRFRGVDAKHSNYYVEFEVVYTDIANGKHEFFSDFIRETSTEAGPMAIRAREGSSDAKTLVTFTAKDGEPVMKLGGDHLLVSQSSDILTGIRDITTDGNEMTNGKIEYFNLMGAKIANPAKGQIVIRVANGKSAKVIF